MAKQRITFDSTTDTDRQVVLLDGVEVADLTRTDDLDNAVDMGSIETRWVCPKIWQFGTLDSRFWGNEGLEDGMPWKVVKTHVRAWIMHNLEVTSAVCAATSSDDDRRSADRYRNTEASAGCDARTFRG